MNNTTATILEARVKAFDRAGTLANQLYDELLPVFTPLIGCKIFKDEGSLLQSVKKELPELAVYRLLQARIYHSSSEYTLRWTINTSENYGEFMCCYEGVDLYFGAVGNGVLGKIHPKPLHRADWTVNEILKLRGELQHAENIVSEIEGRLGDFGKYDR